MTTSITLTPDADYSLRTINDASFDSLEITVSKETRNIMQNSYETFCTLNENGTEIYGTTTGFGPLVTKKSGESSRKHGKNLINHLGAGTGSPLDPHITKMASLIRAISISRGHSAINPDVFEDYLNLIETNVTPVVPEIGSVGASGDLIPMANIVLAYTGDGEFHSGSDKIPSRNYFKNSNKSKLEIADRDALALVNGIPFCSAFAVRSVVLTEKLLQFVEKTSAWLYTTLGCRKDALNEFLNSVKGHESQKEVANRIRSHISTLGGYSEQTDRPLQEVYSLRSIPQVLGSIHTVLQRTRETTADELNGVDDNPIFQSDPENNVWHGANFVGQQIAFAMDYLNNAVTQLGNLIQQHISLLLNPETNNGAPELLASKPGATSGLAGVELNATAIVSEMRNDCQNAASGSLPTNQNNQDLVPMAFEAGKKTLNQVHKSYDLLSMLGVSLVQHSHVSDGDEPPEWFPEFEPLSEDRPLKTDISRISTNLRERPITQ